MEEKPPSVLLEQTCAQVYARFEIVGREAVFVPDEEVATCYNYLAVL